MRLLREIAHPLHPRGGYALPHVVLVALLVLSYVLVGAAGFYGGTVYTSDYFLKHYVASVPVPKTGTPLPIHGTVGASAGSINLARYPAVGDQGPLGECAAWVTAWDLSYEWRMQHPRSWLRFSPRQMYDHYSDTYSGGQDAGSWPDGDAEISDTTGLLQFKALPEPPYVIDNPIPAIDAWNHPTAVDAAKHRFPVTVHNISGYQQGGGQQVPDGIEQAILQNHPVMIALPVYPEWDNATATNGLIGMPQPGESSRGGHEVAAVAFDNTLQFPDGWVGGIEVQNQWNVYWGVQGRGWIETRFAAQYVWGAEYMTIGTGTPTKLQTRGPLPSDGGKAPFIPHRTSTKRVKSTGWYIRPFYTSDTHQNIAPLVNSISSKVGIWPVYSLAVILAESAGNVYSERWGVYPDWSCGLMQQITPNVESFTGLTDARSACNWEEIPANSIYYGTLLLRQYQQETGVGYPALWECYNAGPGSCQSPYYLSFLQNYYVALTYATSDPGPLPQPPAPPKFGKEQARVWSQYRREHHLSFIPHNGWFAWHWRSADWRHAGGIVQREQYDARRRYMFQVTQGFWAFWWPHHPRWGVEWKGHAWLR